MEALSRTLLNDTQWERIAPLLPARRAILAGREEDTGIDFEALIADKAFDNNALRATLNEPGAVAVIPAKADRATPIPTTQICISDNTWSRISFQRLKEFRRVATRYDKTDTSFAAAIYLVGALLALR